MAKFDIETAAGDPGGGSDRKADATDIRNVRREANGKPAAFPRLGC
ncbi:MAG TPA: hypothetical protein VK427_15560 [Kofleriaceae bacterium]|nr:hypothetical protein [Kofleriaceae bacterium]